MDAPHRANRNRDPNPVSRIVKAILIDLVWNGLLQGLGRAALSAGTFWRSWSFKAPESSDRVASIIGLYIVLFAALAVAMAGKM